MSSYKGYVSSWKPNLSPYLSSKTSPAASRYSSRDEVIGSSSDSKAAPRFGSLSSPSSYRPTYSGGTYRSVKRDTPVVPSYTSRWLTSTKEPATKDTGTIKKVAVKPSISNDVTNSSKNKFTKNSQSSTPSENLLSKTKAKEQLSTITRPSITVAKVRIRDVSSSNSSYSTSKSRDASPCEPAKDRYTSSSGYVSSSYSKLYPRSSNKLQVNNFRSRSTSPAVSYLNGSDVAGTYRQNVKQNEDNAKLSTENISSIDETTKMSSTIESLPEANVEMIEVNVVTRGTSPNLCSTSTTHYTRCRRADIAKTIEKTIMRPKRKALTEDKEIQSDRMDDTTKYSRFSSARSTTPWPSYMDNKYNSVSYSRLNMSSNSASSSLSKYSNTSKNAKESTDSGSSEKSVEKSPEKSVSKSSRESSVDSKKSSSISRSNSIKSTSKSEKPKSKSPPVPTSKSTSSSPTKQKVYNSKALLPPQPPKLESPTKVISASCSSSTASSTTNSKWANKDFRKSALNVGQTDRPRKSRTSSASTDSEDNKKLQQKSVSNQMPFSRSDRSPSVSSETSYSSGSNADDVMKNFMKLKISSSSSTTAPITAASNGCAESMQSNSDAVMCENTTKPSDAVQSQTLTTQDSSPHSNESFAKIDNTKLSIVNRVLGPVTKIFKTKSQYLSESHSGSEPDNMISTNDSIKQDTLIDSLLNQTTTTTISNGSKLLNSNNYLADESNWINTTLNEQTTDTQFDKFQSENTTNMKDQLRHIDSDNELPLPWWLNEMENDDTIAEDVTLNQSDNEMTRINNSVDAVDTNQSTPAIPWWMLDHSNSHSDAMKKNCITHVSSGDKAWWLDEDTEESVNDILEAVDTENDNASKFTFKIKKIESGERAWWLCEENTDTVPMEKTHEFDCDDTNNNEKNDNEDVDFWATINESLQSKRATTQTAQTQKQAQHLDQNQYTDRFRYDINANYIPLGDRASPEGLEDMNNRIENGSSPYDNINLSNVESNFEKLFISRHQNIDDVLGKPCHALSPIHLDNDAFEEILPSQVRIHDGTAKNVAIDNEKDNWEYCRQSSQTHSPFRLDDATLQVYKDGDYGAYLDLESSLAEQSEELEGLHSNSRKNSLVVRTQLSVRVHAIIEKLLTSEGRELRRALFSLKQIFQDDKDLVHGFVALGGLNSLVRVGNNSDQNYQNYILRALGQVMLYVDGMNGVMHHSPTIQWLYSLIASKYRLVVKTALKLLLVFVEYVESNCYLLVNAIHVVDAAQDSLPWSNIMRLLKDYENADTELLIYATTLINKTLSGLNDQDSFYDESDFLEQQGMESVIQRYMSRPGTDLDLLDQLQLYDAVLKFEDGETDGIRIPDKSIRKTPRCRSLNANGSDPLERRKSRRHSSDAAPNSADSKCYSPRTPIAIHQTVDEDSSSSINSGELNDVFGVTKGGHENAGVTPGLRRRRERAERQKSFLREQQEAAAAGFRPFDMKDDIINNHDSENDEKRLLLQIKRDHTVKDLTQKLSSLPINAQEEKTQNRIGDMSGLISKAKEGLAKSKSKGDISRSPSKDQEIRKPEPKKSENELHWEELMKNMTRPLNLCDLDFTDLHSDDDKDDLLPRGLGGSVPPPPPPIGIPPPMKAMLSTLEPPPPNMRQMNGLKTTTSPTNNALIKKNKKTVKLFWKEIREDLIPVHVGKTIWDEIPTAIIDTQKLEHLFESRAKDTISKEKQQEMNKNKEIIVLDHKRSNAINIAMTKLPPPRAIKAAILKMDATVVTREGIDKLLNMLPTEEERGKIQEAQMINPELPLGSAEQFLLTLSSISELSARLKLWAFKLDFECSEKEIAEPLMDLKQGLDILRNNKTFKCILSTLLSIGIFLNGAPAKGFQIEYLAKVPEVKDTVHKHSLLHHLCHIVMESSTDTTDLYSEIGSITRASKADFADLAHNITYLESECKASWDRLKLIAKHDCPPQLKQKMVDFLADCAERIIILQIVHRRVINRYRKFLLWLGVPQHRVIESRPNEVCRIISEFALEYRTTRERVHQQLEKKANHRERNKTRGKMIIDVAKFRSKEDRADAELKQLLGSQSPSMDNLDSSCQYIGFRRRRPEVQRSPALKMSEDTFTDGDDEILESLVKTATSTPRTAPRERKRTRNADRKSLRRTLKNGLSEEEKQHVATFIKSY
ncbi:uncharacterized protein LOC116337370 isoform X6 [Contarinia nasturtii]|uniref:uncharacterized protein LOC116337370 isoform X6 n=1 Tax=Contarinia nasturtii TaxID=265458 RepID=UPI0012D43372|nr:uncharacterized protein LOC116337370 isoform X6 [Contarinia nasturtii]